MLRSVSKAKTATVTAIAPMPAVNHPHPAPPAVHALPLMQSPTGSANTPEYQAKKIKNGSVSPTKSNGKGRSTERDSVNALLSLGRDLQAEEAAAAAASPVDQTGTSEALMTGPEVQSDFKPPAKRPPQPLLPEVLASKPAAKKRQRKTAVTPGGEGQNAANNGKHPAEGPKLPDFWFWLPDGESIGEWDVLCGRGGESNNFIGNRRFRNMVHARKGAYREIPVKQRKAKTAFVKNIVNHINNCGGRFVDYDDVSGKYYVVTVEKARKKASQALRETKELKWLELSDFQEPAEVGTKNSRCPFCSKPGHKTKIAKACLKHHEWMASNIATAETTSSTWQESEGTKDALITINDILDSSHTAAGRM